MILFSGILLLSMFAAIVVQHFLPSLPGPWFDGARILIMPVILWYGCASLPVTGMLVMCFSAGLVWDCLTLPISDSSIEFSLGWSIVLYGVLGAIMNGLRPLFRQGHWILHCVIAGFLTSLLVLFEYLIFALVRIMDGGFQFPREVWCRVLGSGLAALLMAPVLFFLLNKMALAVGYDPHPDRKGTR